MLRWFILFFISFLAVFSATFSYSLQITEVFFDGRDEWIEIYNSSDNVFSGNLVISGSDNLTLENVYIGSGDFLIFGETEAFDINFPNVLFGKGLSINDSEEINFDLIKSGQTIDSFVVEKSFVEKLDGEKKSFHMVFSGKKSYITGCRQVDKENIGGDSVGNPGKVRFLSENSEDDEDGNADDEGEGEEGEEEDGDEGDEGGDGEEDGDDKDNEEENDGDEEDGNEDDEGSGDNQENIGYHDLKIAEIFPQDNKYYPEFLAIKAFDDFSGTVYGSGLWRGDAEKGFDLQISSGEKVVVADNPKMLLTGENIKILDENVSLSDGGEIINLYAGTGILIDSIQYPSSRPEKSIFYSGSGDDIREFSDYDSPTPSLDLPEPGNCELSVLGDGTSQELDFAVTGMQDFHCRRYFERSWLHNNEIIPGNDCENTAELTTGKNSIEFQLLSGEEILCNTQKTVYFSNEKSQQNLFSGDLKITEVYPYDEDFPEYIEIKAFGNFSGKLEIGGLGRGDNEKVLDTKLYSGNHLVISDSYSGFVDTSNIHRFDSISLTNDGEELILSGQDGQLFDKAEYEGGNKQKSSYFGFFSGEKRIFSQQHSPTPGFGKDKLQYFVDKDSDDYSNNDCYIRLQNNGSFFSDNSVNFISVLNNQELQNSSEYNCEIDLGNGEIIEKCNPYYTDYPEGGIYEVDLKIYQRGEKICSSKRDLNLPTENENNSNCDSSCKEDYYEDLYDKWKGRYKDLKSQKQKKDELVGSDIKISGILPDPEGADGSKEVLKIKNTGSERVNLSAYHLEYGRRDFQLNGFIQADSVKTFTGKIQLYNRSECIFLKKEDEKKKVYDKFCYLQPDEGEFIEKSMDFLSKFKDLSILSNFDVDLLSENSEICLFYEDRQILCKQVEINTQEEKEKTQQELEKKEGVVEIAGVLPDPVGEDYGKEEIKIKLLSGNSSFENLHLFYSDRKNYIDVNFEDSDVQLISGTFLFLNSTNCIELRDEKYIYDKFCYFQPEEGEYMEDVPQLHELKDISVFSDLEMQTKGKEVCVKYKDLEILCSEVESKKTKTDDTDSTLQPKDIQIAEVFPNPEGADKDKEYIVLKNNEKDSVSLNGYRIEYGRRSYEFTGEIKFDYRKIFGKLRLYNRPSCIELVFSDTETVDEFCYLNPASGIKIKESQDFIKEIGNASILSSFEIDADENHSCLYYDEKKVFCENLPLGEELEEVKEDLVEKNEDVEELEEEVDNYKNKVKLQENFIDIVLGVFKNDWYVAYKKSGLENFEEIFEKAKKNLEEGKEYMNLDYVDVSVTQIKKIRSVQKGDIPFDKLPEYTLNKYVFPRIPDEFLEVFK